MPDDDDQATPADHRKRRRNRMRVSCLNCYASKRKCDRKRPCSRCIKHGLTGLCVYELDDPAARDEPAHLRTRIAELESVIRALNNRPHPRWLAPGGSAHRRAAPVKREHGSPPLTPLSPRSASPASAPFSFGDAPYADARFLQSQSPPAPAPKPRAPSPAPSASSAEGPPLAAARPCACLTNPAVYTPLVHFAHALRTARDALAALHAPGAPCELFRRVAQLDAHIFSAPVPPAHAAPPSPPPCPLDSPLFSLPLYAPPPDDPERDAWT